MSLFIHLSSCHTKKATNFLLKIRQLPMMRISGHMFAKICIFLHKTYQLGGPLRQKVDKMVLLQFINNCNLIIKAILFGVTLLFG